MVAWLLWLLLRWEAGSSGMKGCVGEIGCCEGAACGDGVGAGADVGVGNWFGDGWPGGMDSCDGDCCGWDWVTGCGGGVWSGLCRVCCVDDEEVSGSGCPGGMVLCVVVRGSGWELGVSGGR